MRWYSVYHFVLAFSCLAAFMVYFIFLARDVFLGLAMYEDLFFFIYYFILSGLNFAFALFEEK
jgi:hypothetical protein